MGFNPIWGDLCTVWHYGADGTCEPVVYHGVRVEDVAGEQFGEVQPIGASSMRVFFRPGANVSPGDYIAVGAHGDPEPPEGCRRVETVFPWTLCGRPHHLEVKAR